MDGRSYQSGQPLRRLRRHLPMNGEEFPEGDGRRDGDDLLIMSFDQLPSTLVHHAMVAPTEQDQVVKIGRTALDPMHQVMSIAHRGGAFAPRPLAAPVASPQAAAQNSREDPPRS